LEAAIQQLTINMKTLPTEENGLISERTRVSELLTGARQVLARQEPDAQAAQASKQEFEQAQTALQAVKQLKCDSLDSPGSLRALNSFRTAFQRFVEPDIFTRTGATTSLTTALGSPSVKWVFNEKPRPALCKDFKNAILEPSLDTLLDTAAKARQAEIEKSGGDRQATRDRATALVKLGEEYQGKLNEAISKHTTKLDLGRKLYLMLLVIGALSIAAILAVRLFPEAIMVEWVASGQVIQFVTVMILLSVIMALGLSDILKENVLGTLLGGIAGYVLAQGVGRAAARGALIAGATRTPPGTPASGVIQGGTRDTTNQAEVTNTRKASDE
jgi:hypothetical protein